MILSPALSELTTAVRLASVKAFTSASWTPGKSTASVGELLSKKRSSQCRMHFWRRDEKFDFVPLDLVSRNFSNLKAAKQTN